MAKKEPIYLLDTDTIIYYLKAHDKVVAQLLKIPAHQIYTSRINLTELLYGAYNSTKVQANLELIHSFSDAIGVLEFDAKASELFAKHKAKLKKSGNLIADMDLMIGSIALANHAILVTNNTKHFAHIDQLQLENWS